VYIKTCRVKFRTSENIQNFDKFINYSNKLTSAEKSSQKYILVPGFGANSGIKESHLSDLLCDICKNLTIKPTEFIEDIEWLLDEGVLKRY